jgi:hypothetical protein
MTHLAATLAESAQTKVTANLRPALKSHVQTPAAPDTSGSAVSTIDSPVAIFLEKRRAPYHYSVIGLDARISLAPEIADCHVLNAEVSASSSRGDNVVARAPAGNDCALTRLAQVTISNRQKKD